MVSPHQPFPGSRLQNGSVFKYSISSGNLNITEELDGLNQTSTLTIEPTSALDTANYSCRVMNGFGQRESEQTEVIVFCELLDLLDSSIISYIIID